MPRDLYQGLLKRKEVVSFHMPGHKSKHIEGMEDYLKNLPRLDLTELYDTDDLYHPTGLIQKSEESIALFSHAKKSKFLVNGSTSGILASILGIVNEGDSILVEETCHKSVINGLRLAKGDLYKVPVKDPQAVASQESLIAKAQTISDLKAILITRPNYYGIYQPIDKLVAYCKEQEIKLIVDEAHGSHFALDCFDKNAMEEGCDVSINSFHKTLPAFTQTAILNLNTDRDTEKKILKSLEMIMTSSPSYILMTSIEFALDYVTKNKDSYKNLKGYIDSFYQEIEGLDFIRQPPCPHGFKRDFTRIVLDCDDPSDLNKHLLENGIYIEMHDQKSLVLIASLVDEESDYQLLSQTIKSYKKYDDKKTFKTYDHLQDKVLENDIVVYPPGKIILERGRAVTKEVVDILNKLSESNVTIYL
ncbi:MAG: aminotransferase class I/II-fold pyridoxal phosphate-dependent enzyme [Finegoldia sp.]|nr:aminotransferase class I/II-fold pyridoxal phosphate-dependent enzyme [Finegoldia sp.]